MRKEMNMKNRLLASILIIGICAAGFPVSAGAEEVPEGNGVIRPVGIQEIELELDPDVKVVPGDGPNGSIQPFAVDTAEADVLDQVEERIKEALLAGETSVDLLDMQIPRDANVQYVIYYSPYLSNGINATFYASSDGYVTRAALENTMTVEETESYFSQVDGRISQILSLVSSDMTDERKALIIHDYLVYEAEYDYDNMEADTLPDDSYRSGGLLMNGAGVCQAYSYAYKYLMNQLDIESFVTFSIEMNHAWNIVNIDGDYYHVDCTWDDPVYERLGKVDHAYFLVSDEAMQQNRDGASHEGWDLTELVCDNTQYDDAYWTEIESQIIFDDDSSYYVEGSSIYKRTEETGDAVALKDVGLWYAPDGSGAYDTVSYSGLFMYNDELYYNTAEEIRKIDLNGENDELVFTPDTSDGSVYGSRRSGKEILYEIKQSPLESGNRYSCELYGEEEQTGFTDVSENDWFYDAVSYVSEQGIMTGLTQTEFGPEETLSRSQFAVILYRMEDSPEIVYTDKFDDVEDDIWYTDGILWAAENEIVTGYGDTGLYGVNDNITREQMAVMMYRYAKYKGYDTSETAQLDQFIDQDLVSIYAREALSWAVGSGLMTGQSDTELDPSSNSSRCECAAIIMRFMEKYV